jgi:hypothetical protein
MAKKVTTQKPASPEDEILLEVGTHYTRGFNENDTRRTNKNGWNDVLKGYFGILPANWPYISRVTDPIIRTTILEKTARLFNGKLKGNLVPREGGDIIKAKIQNSILDYQWDAASEGGSMIEKWALMDMQTRIFGTSFALSYWFNEEQNGKDVFEGNEMKVLDNRDIVVDYTSTHVKNANWALVREWMSIDEMEEKNKLSPEPIYKNIQQLKDAASFKEGQYDGDSRNTKYDSLVKQLRGIEDHVGTDRSFPVFEIVTEYRRDRWITWAPRYKVLLRDIDNPYDHKQIPIIQLRYYPVGDDVYGESEVGPVLPIWRAIQATLCGFIDQMALSMRPPIKIANNSEVRLDTLVYGPNAKWLVGSRQENVMEFQSSGSHITNFQNAYGTLISRLKDAMGETSQGISTLDPMGTNKTATEVKDVAQQRQSRDQYNQMYLEEALKDQMMFWVSNNQQFLFDDPSKHSMVFRIVGREAIQEYKQLGLDEMDLPDQSVKAMQGIIEDQSGNVSNSELGVMKEATSVPRYPVIMNPSEKNPENFDVRAKMNMDDTGMLAELLITPDDMTGLYDYKPSVKSMSLDSNAQQTKSLNDAFMMMINPQVGILLQAEGVKPKIKELLVALLENGNYPNADKLFEDVPAQQPMQPGMPGQPQGMPPQAPQGPQGGQMPPQGMQVPPQPMQQLTQPMQGNSM